MMSEKEYLDERLNKQIAWYSKKANLNKKYSNTSKISIIIFASSITVFTQIEIEPNIKNSIISVLAALIAIISGISGILKFQEKWAKYRTTAETLKHEKFLFLSRTGPYQLNANPFTDLVPRVENLISKENTGWNDIITSGK